MVGDNVRWLRKKVALFRREDTAVAGVIVAVMIVGLVLAVISIVQTMYVPKWMDQIESEHMDDVADQFAMLKYAIDSQLLAGHETPLSTPITLGSNNLPFLISSKAFGNLALLPSEFIIKIEYGNENATHHMGTIKYSSQNSYYLDQSYIYEAGALILSQSQGSVMSMTPSCSATFNATDGLCKLSFNLTNIKGVGGKTTMNGYGTYPIQTHWASSKVIGDPDPPIEDVGNITITSSYPNVWASYFNRTLTNADMEKGDTFNITIDETSGEVTIHFKGDKVNIEKPTEIYLTIHTIKAQIAPGWVE